MKKLILLSALLIFACSYGQTPITDANFSQAIETCLSTHPVTGMCSDSEYGAMPNWDVSSVTDMDGAFYNRPEFNADISNWDVSNVTDMSYMFLEASSFNQPIGNWDVSSVTNMIRMFEFTFSFNQDISSWCVTNIASEPTYFSYNSPLIESNKPVWGTCPSLGIDDLNQLDISIYPNPTSDTVNIDSSSSQLKIVVFDILGKQVLNKPNTNSVDVSSLSKGAYFIKVSDGINTSTKKFIKN